MLDVRCLCRLFSSKVVFSEVVAFSANTGLFMLQGTRSFAPCLTPRSPLAYWSFKQHAKRDHRCVIDARQLPCLYSTHPEAQPPLLYHPMRATSLTPATFHTRLSLILLCLLGGANGLLAQKATPFVGQVLSVVPDRQALVVQAAGSDRPLTVDVGSGDYQIARPEWAIQGELVPYAGRQLLQNIRPNNRPDVALIERLDRQLQQDTLTRGSRAFRGIGERIPRFALWQQDGTLFHSDSLRGQYAVVNFIFTRCQSPNMCPAATQRMAQLQAAAKERSIEDLHLVSITLDPDFDTPGIFAAYAGGRGIESHNFSFLSGPARVVENLKIQLGVLSEPDDKEIIRHTLSTALIDPSGEIIYRIPGSMWDPEVFLSQIAKHRARAAAL